MALLLVASYGLLVQSGKVPSGQGVSQYQLNWVTLEKFATDPMPQVEAVICGSSMGQTLKPQLIDKRFYNLSVLGTSGLTGLKAVNASPNKPRLIFVEMSFTLANGVETQMLNSMLSPYHKWVAEHAKFLRQDYQPTDILLSKFRRKSLAGQDNPASPEAIAGAVRRHTVPTPAWETNNLETVISGLKTEIATAQARGCKVVLLEMLASAEVEATPKFVGIRERIAREFPQGEYTWSQPMQQADVVTSDGIHLVPSKAAEVSRALIEALGS
ncbi:MAG: hypothetical protein JNJ45_01595 [Chthonomonas sp.]|nr:hypothetical protein [Chthonomonas sp.]